VIAASIGLHHTGIKGEAFAPDQAGGHAGGDDAFKEVTKHIASDGAGCPRKSSDARLRDAMPIFGNLLSVGIALFLGLLAVSTQFGTERRTRRRSRKAQRSAALFSAKSY